MTYPLPLHRYILLGKINKNISTYVILRPARQWSNSFTQEMVLEKVVCDCCWRSCHHLQWYYHSKWVKWVSNWASGVRGEQVECMSVNGNVSYWDYIALVTDEWIHTGQRWNDTDGKIEVLRQKNLSYYHFVHHKSHLDWPGIKLRPPE